MKAEYYFLSENDEICYNKAHFLDLMEQEGWTEIEVYKAVPEKYNGIFWCKHDTFCGDSSSEYCGKQCKTYAPRNGKSGRCKYYSNILYGKGEQLILTL